MAKSKNLKEFMEKLEKDRKLLKGIQEATDKDPENGAYKFALKNSDGEFSKEEFIDQTEKLLNKSIKSVDKLDEQMLENVAGGDDTDNRYTVSAAKEEGKWNAITAGINSIQSIKDLINTLANIWATYVQRKDNMPLMKAKIKEVNYRILEEKIALMDKYHITANQLEQLLEEI